MLPLSGLSEVAGWKGRRFAAVDLSCVAQPGRYTTQLAAESGACPGPSFVVDGDEPGLKIVSDLVFHLRSQRSGGITEKTDRSLPVFGEEDKRVDAHGGWYDASGDISKYLSHLSYAEYFNPQQIPLVVWALASPLPSLRSSGSEAGVRLAARMAEEAAYGADFILRMQDAESRRFYITVFDVWSKDPQRRIVCTYRTQQGIIEGNALAGWKEGGGMAIAALACASATGISGDYAARDYLVAALSGWKALAYGGPRPGTVPNIIDDYCALLASAELLAAVGTADGVLAEEIGTKTAAYASSLSSRFSGMLNGIRHWTADPEGSRPYFHASDAGLPVIALLEYARVSRSGASRDAALETAFAALDAELALVREVNNPFGLARQATKAVDGPARTAFFMPHRNETGYWWQGENARLASLATAARMGARLYARNGDSRKAEALRAFAQDQIDWIMGRNPFDVCMMQGKGRNEPFYGWYGMNGPGGVANGVTSGFDDEDDIGFLPEPWASDGRHRWRWSEQWLPHAAWLMAAEILR
jgi:hypothetical protein